VRRFSGVAVLSLILWLPASGGVPGMQAETPQHAAPPDPPQMSGIDRLAEPELSESPTQVEKGRNLYYFHCMPCHGDSGQGLTDEWREVWVEDHQNCWARGCHTGKSELTAFYIPRSIPPVSDAEHALASFQSAEELFTFLRETQPPQRPGALSEGEYWALTAFLLHENDRLPSSAQIGPSTRGDVVVAATLGLFLMLAILSWAGRRPERWDASQRTPGTNFR
jgi:hypothetical protein